MSTNRHLACPPVPCPHTHNPPPPPASEPRLQSRHLVHLPPHHPRQPSGPPQPRSPTSAPARDLRRRRPRARQLRRGRCRGVHSTLPWPPSLGPRARSSPFSDRLCPASLQNSAAAGQAASPWRAVEPHILHASHSHVSQPLLSGSRMGAPAAELLRCSCGAPAQPLHCLVTCAPRLQHSRARGPAVSGRAVRQAAGHGARLGKASGEATARRRRRRRVTAVISIVTAGGGSRP